MKMFFCVILATVITSFFYRKPDNPFEAKPKLARKTSLRELNRKIENNEVQQLDFNPNGGVTFRENPASDVAIFGKGIYGDNTRDTHNAASEYKPSTQSLKGKNKKNNKSKYTILFLLDFYHVLI